MNLRTITSVAITLAALSLFPGSATAQGVAMIEDFESYESGLGFWSTTGVNNITANTELAVTGAIDGSQDLKVTLGLSLLGASYTIGNQNLDVAVPGPAQNLQFKIRPLIALNVARTVTAILRDANNVTYTSPAVSLGLLTPNTVTDVAMNLSTFTPPATSGSIASIQGLSLKFDTSLASLAAEEHIDSIRFTWSTSSVPDWSCY
jgi:hypothetical protein